MKRNIILVIVICLISICTSCSSEDLNINTSNEEDEMLSITIPESYFEYSGTDVAEAVELYKELGDKYCTDAEVSGSDVIIKVTENQKENLIKRNEDYMKELLESFLEADSNYRYEGNDEYTELAYFYDEKLSTKTQIQAIYGVSAGYALNYILENNSSDWNVHIKIYNCHTNKLVVEGRLPEETISFGEKEWKESYNE